MPSSRSASRPRPGPRPPITRGPLSLVDSPTDERLLPKPSKPLTRITEPGADTSVVPFPTLEPNVREIEQAIEEVLQSLDAQPVSPLPPGFAQIIGRLRQWEELDAHWTPHGDLQPEAIAALAAILRDIPPEERNGPDVIERLAHTLPIACWWGWLRTAQRTNRSDADVAGIGYRVVLNHYLPALVSHHLWAPGASAQERLTLLEQLWGRWCRYQRDQPDTPHGKLIEDLLTWRQIITQSLRPHEVLQSPVLGRIPASLSHLWQIPGAAWVVRDTQVLQPAVLVMQTRGWLLRSLNADGPLGWSSLADAQRLELTEAVAKTILQASGLLQYDEPTGIRAIRSQDDPILESLRQAHQRLLGALVPGPCGEALRSCGGAPRTDEPVRA